MIGENKKILRARLAPPNLSTLAENILKNSTKYSIKLTNLKEFLLQKTNLQICDPSPSSWGQGGYHNYWINDANAWIVPEITKAGSTFVDLCSKNFKNELSPRLFKQAARAVSYTHLTLPTSCAV